MADGSMNRVERDYLERWWEATRYYLFADIERLPEAAFDADDGWSPPQTDSQGGRKKFIARVRGRLLRSLRCGEQGDPLRELENAFQQQIAFIARRPDVPRRLLSWLAQDGDPGLQRRVRMLVAYYAKRLARIIACAQQQGLVKADVQPSAAAISLVGVIQGLVHRTTAAPQWRKWFLQEAAEAFALYRDGLAVSPD